MSSVKCQECGLVNWITAENCKRCGLAVAGGPADDNHFDESESYAPPVQTGSFTTESLDEEQWLHRLKRDSRLFYVIGGLQILLWLFVGNLLIIDGVFNIGLSYVANKFRSRIAASCLVVLTVLSVMSALVALATGALRFNLLTPVVLIGRIVTSVRMVYCTFKLNTRPKVDVAHMLPPLPPVFHQEESAQWAQPGAQWQPE
ncbi:MAG: hypothetical protein QOK48_1985 [Blastocatellia bacterium]|jgi:hypothetical protein|nr:hypothetical protein [Blastocatellia bacterium]